MSANFKHGCLPSITFFKYLCLTVMVFCNFYRQSGKNYCLFSKNSNILNISSCILFTWYCAEVCLLFSLTISTTSCGSWLVCSCLNTLPVLGKFKLAAFCSGISFNDFLAFFYCVIGITETFPNFFVNVTGLEAPEAPLNWFANDLGCCLLFVLFGVFLKLWLIAVFSFDFFELIDSQSLWLYESFAGSAT